MSTVSTGALACPTFRADTDIVVAVRDEARPFTDLRADGTPEGFSVALWKSIAEELRVADGAGGTRLPSFEFVQCQSIDGQQDALMSGLIDVVISPLTITAERMERFDFSQQYISSGLSVALPSQNAINWDTAKSILQETLLSRTLGMAIIGFLAFNLALAALIRWILFSPEEKHAGGAVGDWIRALLEAIMRTIGLRGVSDAYKSATAKIFEIFMAVVGTALSAALLGVMTSAFVGSVGKQRALDASSLTTLRVATLECSTAQDLLLDEYRAFAGRLLESDTRKALVEDRVAQLDCDNARGPEPITLRPELQGTVVLTQSWAQAMALLAEESVDVVLGDWVAMTYLSRNTYSGSLEVQESVYRNEPYGWGISRVSVPEDLRRDIDRVLIERMRHAAWRPTLEAALGEGSVSPN